VTAALSYRSLSDLMGLDWSSTARPGVATVVGRLGWLEVPPGGHGHGRQIKEEQL